MKIVIDISDAEYERIQAMDWKNGDRWYSCESVAIHNGTPLPKGHGDLIDKNDLINGFRDSKKGFWRKKHFIKGEATMESMAYEINDIKNILNNAPTIIKADTTRDCKTCFYGQETGHTG